MKTAHEVVREFVTANTVDRCAFNQWFDDAGYAQEEANVHDCRYLTHLKEYVEERDEEDARTQPGHSDALDAPPRGHDWCRNGCQPLHGMECGICGYDGPGVGVDDTDTVAEYCRHCRARTRQSRESICTLCGKNAEDAEEPAYVAAESLGIDELLNQPP